jgi:hypothetical protein
MVIVYLPQKETRVSEVVGDLGVALRTADAYPTRPSVVVSGSLSMLNHSRGVLKVPPQAWLTTKSFLAHIYAVSALFDFKTEVIQNVTNWDIKKAKAN